MKMDALIIAFLSSFLYQTGKILSIGYNFPSEFLLLSKFLIPWSDNFSTPVHEGPKGLLQTADSIFIEFTQ
jgi:hypothetical protein